MVTKFSHGQATRGALHCLKSGNDTGHPVLLLHGLFGMGSNLGALARALAADFQIHQLDLPNHGRSFWDDEMSLASLASAVQSYAEEAGLARFAVVGHSLGGKVAMELALAAPERVSALVVADIAPVAYPGSHDKVFEGIRAVAAARPASRREAGDIMADVVDEKDVVAFLLLSLRRTDDGTYTWRFNAQALERNYDALRAAPDPRSGFTNPALFVYGARSSYVDDTGMDAARALFGDVRFHAIEGAGHWLHAEEPGQFNGAVAQFLQAVLDDRRGTS